MRSSKNPPMWWYWGPHDYHLLLMHKAKVRVIPTTESDLPSLAVAGGWQQVLSGKAQEWLERAVLPTYLKKARWFGGKGFTINIVKLGSALPMALDDTTVFLLFIEVSYIEKTGETYLLPLYFVPQPEAREFQKEAPEAVIARLESEGGKASWSTGCTIHGSVTCCSTLLAGKGRLPVPGGELAGNPGRFFRRVMGTKGASVSLAHR